jgi:long-chain fatty acid transport protein
MPNLKRVIVLFFLFLMAPIDALATNGDNLIGVGPISRAMGGVGIAAPQDAISAVFSNPAAMCFGAFCPSNQVDFAATAFMPNTHGQVNSGPFTYTDHSSPKVYPIPALGISFNFPELPSWRFGLGAYGVSGLGVDYRSSALDQPNYFGPGAPLAAGTFSDLNVMKFAPTVAYQVNHWLSLGAAVHIVYSALDLGSGQGTNFGIGAQIGAIVKPVPKLSLGFSYTTPQQVDYNRVIDGANGNNRTLTLGSPHNIGVGVAYEFLPKKLLVETNFKWLNWNSAVGYHDFDWANQWVVNVGVQYKPIPKLALRLGYNYGNNPVKTHNNFNGMTMTSVQGTLMPTYYYESFRMIGFPAVVTNHITCGVGYDVTDRFTVNLGYMHAFENSVSEGGTNLAGQSAGFKSRLSEDGVDFGFSWRF